MANCVNLCTGYIITVEFITYVTGLAIGAMLHEGLLFGQLLEVGRVSFTNLVPVTTLIRPCLQLVFSFVQVYFIFLNSKVSIAAVVLGQRSA